MGPVLFEWSKAPLWSGCSRSWEKATAARSLCYSTSQPLHQGAKIREEQSLEELLAKCSIKSFLCSARLRVDPHQGKHHPFPTALKMQSFSCAYSCLLVLLIIVLEAAWMNGNGSGPFTSEKASSQLKNIESSVNVANDRGLKADDWNISVYDSAKEVQINHWSIKCWKSSVKWKKRFSTQ